MCDCKGLSFEGVLRHPIPIPNEKFSSFALERSEIPHDCNSSICNNANEASISTVCEDTSTSLSTSFCLVKFDLSSSLTCIDVRMSEMASDVFSQAITTSVSVSFVPVDQRTDPLAVVMNQNKVVVGQLVSNVVVLQFIYPNFVNVTSSVLELSFCFKGENRTVDSKYTIYDVGTNLSGLIQPLGLMRNMSVMDEFCFENFSASVTEIVSYVLIIRTESYQSEVLLNSNEKRIIFTTAALYLFGCVIVVCVMIANVLILLKLPVRAVVIWVLSIGLMMIRCCYFFLIGFGDLEIGGLADFVMIEMPTFFYISIFVLILIPLAAFHKYLKTQIEVPKRQVVLFTVFCLLIVWMLFAGIVIALSIINVSSKVTQECYCRISTSTQPSDAPLYIRIGYKSGVVGVALCVVLLVFFFTKETLYYRKRILFLEILGISMCLLMNCVAFVIYYIKDQATPYFAIVLWVTELLPIVMLCITIGWPGLQYIRLTLTSSVNSQA